MTYARIKMLSPEGDVVDFTIDQDAGEDFGQQVIDELAALTGLGFKSFAMQAPVAAPTATGAPADVEVPKEQAQPGQLAKRFQSAVIEVEPRQDGKSKVSFYGADIKPPMNDFPYVVNVYKTETWAKKFAGIVDFTPAHFAVPARYSVVADVEVRYGDKKNTQGNLYRNISNIQASPGVGPQSVTAFAKQEEEATVAPSEEIPF